MELLYAQFEEFYQSFKGKHKQERTELKEHLQI